MAITAVRVLVAVHCGNRWPPTLWVQRAWGCACSSGSNWGGWTSLVDSLCRYEGSVGYCKPLRSLHAVNW